MDIEYAHSSNNVNAYSCFTNNNCSGINNSMNIGERLRTARKHAGLTQIELAEKSHVPQQTISKIERGDAETSGFIVQLAVACGVRPEWLAMESGEMVDGLYVHDEKLKRLLIVAQKLPDYAIDKALREVAEIAEFIEQATKAAKQ